jgi:hypothetical protein
MNTVLIVALEQLVENELALIFVFDIVCVVFVILFWVLF